MKLKFLYFDVLNFQTERTYTNNQDINKIKLPVYSPFNSLQNEVLWTKLHQVLAEILMFKDN